MKVKISYCKKKYEILVIEKDNLLKYEINKLDELKEVLKINKEKVEIFLQYSLFKFCINKFPKINKKSRDRFLNDYLSKNYKNYILFDKFIIKKKNYNLLISVLVNIEIDSIITKIFNKYKYYCIYDNQYCELLKKYSTNIYIKDNELVFSIDKELIYCSGNIEKELECICDYIVRGLYQKLYYGNLYIFSNKDSFKISKKITEILQNKVEKKVNIIEMAYQ